MYVVGYPKSGNTWFCFLLAFCLNAEYDDLDAPGIHPTNEYQRRYVKGGLAHPSYQNQTGQILKTHRQESLGVSAQEPLIYLIRDGRDVMVSYYFYRYTYVNTRKSGIFKSYFGKIVNKRHLMGFKFHNNQNHQDFSAFLQQYTDEWVTHVATWLERQPTAIIRYEDLKTAPENTLNQLFAMLNVPVAPEIIQQALEIFDFKQLAQRKAGEEDRSSFFRKGIVGDWKNHFSAADLEFFQQKAVKVMNLAGYEI